jgi:hypothetical protein
MVDTTTSTHALLSLCLEGLEWLGTVGLGYTSRMTKEPKHHYIPEFYLKQWVVGENRQLIEFCRRYKGVVSRPTAPGGTGYVRGLYRLPDAPPGEEYVVETGLMSDIDSWASRALARMMTDGAAPGTMDRRMALGWCQFLYSLIVRDPEQLDRIKEKLKSLDALEVLENIREDYPKLRRPEDPATFDEYKAAFALNPIDVPATRVLPVLLKSKRVMAVLAALQWRTATVNSARYPLLTSDRPVIMSNGLSRPDAHIVLPISPRRLFVATKDEQTFQDIIAGSMDLLAKTVNNQVAQQAYQYVYGSDDKQLRFVSNRLGRRIWSSPLG